MLRSLAAAGCIAVLGPTSAHADGEPFQIVEIATAHRVAQADIVDLDGDGRGDLLWTSIENLPPSERRRLHVHFQRADGTLPERADWQAQLSPGVAAYDLAELDAAPGWELLLLRRDGLSVLSFPGREPRSRELRVPGGPTVAAVGDERGIDRLRIARAGLADEPWLVVPGLGETYVLKPSGEVVGTLDTGARANFFIQPRPGAVVAESEIEMYFDHPRINVGDIDGDGRGDILSSNRHELRVFLQRSEGGFAGPPSRSHAFGLITIEDHIRSSGSVRVVPGDFDLDGRLDLCISSSTGSFLDATTRLGVFLNRDGAWRFTQPDQEFVTQGGLTANQVVDLDGDGRPELIDARVPTGVLEIVEVLLTRAIDAQIKIYRADDAKPFADAPWHEQKLDLPISFETFRSAGFVPTFEPDLNGDGWHDLIDSGGGEAIEIHLGREKSGFSKLDARQLVPTSGRVRFGDFDADGLTDIVLYDPRHPGTPIRIGVNRGVLPGTVRPPTLSPTPG